LGPKVAALVARVALELVDRNIAGRFGLADRHQTQRDRFFSRSFDPDRSIDAPLAARRLEKRNEIEAVSLTVEPARVVPPGAHDDVGTGVEFLRDPVRLQIGAIAHADFAGDGISPIDDLSFALIRQFKGGEALARQIKDRMDAPPAALLARSPPGLRNRRGIDKPDRSAFGRSHAALAGVSDQADPPVVRATPLSCAAA